MRHETQHTGCTAVSSQKRRTATSTYGHQINGQVLEWCGRVGGDAKTVQAFSSEQGGDPRTDHASLRSLGGDPKADHEASKRDRGGDPKTDHSHCVNARFGGNSPRLGRLATQTATSDPVSPGLNPDFAVSRGFGHGSEVRDGFPSIEEDPNFRDGLPSIGVTQGHEHFHGSLLDRLLEKRFSNSSSDNADIAISRLFHDDEMSEQLRQSDLKVQNLPASVSTSELSAHQMGGTLAGRFGHERIDGHPPDYLSLPDRALLRRYSKVYCAEAVQSKSDGLRSRGDEPTRTIKDVSADASCLEVSTETVVSPVPIAVTVSPIKDDLADCKRMRSQVGKRKRRRYTGKAVKNNVEEQVPIIKDVPTDEKLQVFQSYRWIWRFLLSSEVRPQRWTVAIVWQKFWCLTVHCTQQI